MPAWLLSIVKLIGTALVERLASIIIKYAKEKYEQHKTNKEVKRAVKQLRESKNEKEIRAALRNLLP